MCPPTLFYMNAIHIIRNNREPSLVSQSLHRHPAEAVPALSRSDNTDILQHCTLELLRLAQVPQSSWERGEFLHPNCPSTEASSGLDTGHVSSYVIFIACVQISP